MRRSCSTGAVAVLLCALVVGCTPGTETSDAKNAGAEKTCGLDSLPPQAATTVDLIESGGPFPYPRNDGVVFGNFEGLLPKHERGYYHEYTVPTPGMHHRGQRRIVTGGQPLNNPAEYFYTGDHYQSFCQIGDM
ncbi:ribonuclease [Mycobacterium sp. 21AC1]|uniref:ribonuclease domain-containing protein n=1 Tax=[Mycobacterium] appelbergii TaxID=2939269 RepID=UPI0029394F82|nr:ribonuclease domain-containing protein [Mycobacterium sp. 21AC1]MDV3130392.1 ribonuclease [Mycobacterium sp. 21AC1]